MDDYESVLLVKPEVFVYQIPPRATSRGYRAADWNLSSPNWTGRMRVVVKSGQCMLKLEDKLSGQLFAQGPIEKYPSVAIESVTDSSRYFVVRIQDDSGKNAFIGLGFGDRSDSFDLNVALQDHFKYLKQEKEAEDALLADSPTQAPLDLGFKEGQTIKINMKIAKKDGQDTPLKQKSKPTGGLGLLPPPPAAKIDPPSPKRSPNVPTNQSQPNEWGDFATARTTENSATIPKESAAPPNPNWVTF